MAQRNVDAELARDVLVDIPEQPMLYCNMRYAYGSGD
jgi:hypothetical protein